MIKNVIWSDDKTTIDRHNTELNGKARKSSLKPNTVLMLSPKECLNIQVTISASFCEAILNTQIVFVLFLIHANKRLKHNETATNC
ncbi:CLUMA_CG021498, isoform A [Clunio marinus]|uniref:CLUMA_CG021498, isoform A n=1 Tax=Clunio marinus TaxID=568069 RepID=A0A1J1J8X4_9DIPT|nr:CLUMA_CG021498, isoform A [Clunio marinus]